jgi:hypothetical protein
MATNNKRAAMLVQDFMPESDTFFLGIKPLNTRSVAAAKNDKARIIPVAAKHLCREIPAEVCRSGGRIDPRRSAQNYTLIPGMMSEAAITAQAIRVMAHHRIEWRQARRDQIMGVELVFSLPAGFGGDQRHFFTECLRWTERHFSQPVQIIAAVVHLDEAAPHLHVVLVPIVALGQMSGHDVVGYTGLYAKRINSFHEEVAQLFGLRKPRSRSKMSSAQRHHLANLIIDQLMADGWVGTPASVKAMLRKFAGDPLPIAESMGLSAQDADPAKSQPKAYAVAIESVPPHLNRATALLCNAVHGSASTNDAPIGSSDTVQTTLTAPPASSRIVPSERPRTKEWVKMMTRATVPEKPAWKPRQPLPISPPIIPSKPGRVDTASPEPTLGTHPPARTPARSQVMLGLRAAGHMRGRTW